MQSYVEALRTDMAAAGDAEVEAQSPTADEGKPSARGWVVYLIFIQS